MAKTRGQVTLSYDHTTRSQGFNMGELKGSTLKGGSLFEVGCMRIIPTAMFRVWGPKTSFAVTEKEVTKDGFEATGLWLKPMHGFPAPSSNDASKGVVLETDGAPIEVEFDGTGDEGLLTVRTAKRAYSRKVDAPAGKRDNALLREVCKHVLPTIVQSIRSPRACLIVSEKEIDNRSFKLTACVAYPVLKDVSVEGTIFETDSVPVTVSFEMPSEEDNVA